MREWLWRGGPLRRAVAVGLFGALVAVVSQLAVSVSAVAAVAGGLVGGVLLGAIVWRRGDHLSVLSPSDRVSVIRAVDHGEPVSDPRLAPDVLTFAKVVMSAAGQEQRQRWVVFVLPALTIPVAVAGTVAGSVRLAAYFWAVTVFFLVFAWLLPRRVERKLKNAGEAARIAKDQITGPGGT
jgi:hypothetical protein